MRIVAMDPSLTRTGICVWHEDGTCITMSRETEPGAPWQDRVRAIVRAALKQVSGETLVVIEGAMMSARVGPETMWLHGILRYELSGYWAGGAVPTVDVAPATRAKWACGHQKNRDKDAVAMAAARAGSPAQNNDEADAWWLADMAAHAYGLTTERIATPGSFEPPPLYRVECLAKVRWPELDGLRDWKALLPAKTKRAKR